MTKNFKEAVDEFRKLMGEYNNKLVTTDGQILPDVDTENNDNIISPNHYASDKGFEVFDVQEAFIHELKGMAASYWCNVVKYILRFQRKNGVEDLKKAKYYLEKLIDEETNNDKQELIDKQEQLYTVELPNPNKEEHPVLYKNRDGKVSIIFPSVPCWREVKNAQLTESEIKEDFEWAWQFAEEVKE